MARVLRGGDYFKRKTFLLRISRMQDFLRIGWFMIIGILWKVTGKTVNSTIFYFDRKRNTGKMEIQAEGEYKELREVQKIEFRKTKEPLQIL